MSLSRTFTVVCLYFLAVGTVSAETVLVVDVELSPPFAPGSVTRCICFDLFDCCNLPTKICQEVMFTNGVALGVELLVASDKYICVEARDPLHSLRSVARVKFGFDEYSASFVGDPELGGNWLIGGNLNDDFVIDLTDFAIFQGEVGDGVVYATGDTTCETEVPHADINGDARINLLDGEIILNSFLVEHKTGCQQRVCSNLDAVGRGSTMQVDIQLSPEIVYGPITRCVCFTLFDCCTGSTEVCQDVTFTAGLATDIPVPLPLGRFPYRCMEARDPLHTLASVSDVTFDGIQSSASFVGDPDFGGNWLITGNLNGDQVIDVLDLFLVLDAIAVGAPYPSGDTTCETEPPHTDINGDGLVDNIDHAHVVGNLSATDKLGCDFLVCADLGESDGDGIINCCDPCPRDRPDDTDGDGVCDSNDTCPGADDADFGPCEPDIIPTVSQWGLAILALLLMTGAKIGFRHRAHTLHGRQGLSQRSGPSTS